ncbi:hypothetical protein ACF3MZ_10510 [Paenibacillaceae bacterium WGS1546]|uniref:hypothetical protein n=1 Tax=Cohnella sp. WGS1546 TaxID=3366810 RepID=UPI00372D208B
MAVTVGGGMCLRKTEQREEERNVSKGPSGRTDGFSCDRRGWRIKLGIGHKMWGDFKMNDQVFEHKLSLMKAELSELSYRDFELITTGCQKDVLILDKKTVISFYRNVANKKKF